ncbi:hypothetical protein [Ideonella sp.]|uniref:hypothetical protein n=1 Tax=Ideonella sp. TaxID=1929293 RepID=UPI003BB7C85B
MSPRHAIAAALLSILGASASAATPPPTYDEFTSLAISPDLWNEGATIRQVDSKGKLNLARYIYGNQSSNAGQTVENLNLSLTDNAPAKSLRAVITATEAASIQGCAANTSSSNARARIIGAYFNVRAGGPVPGDATGDILAQAYLIRYSDTTDAAGVVQVGGNIVQCNNSDCSSSSLITSVSMGTTTVGTAVGLQIDWDKKNSQFLFTRGKEAAVPASYLGLKHTVAPARPFNNVSIRTAVANCMGSPRVKAGMAASFDVIGISHF